MLKKLFYASASVLMLALGFISSSARSAAHPEGTISVSFVSDVTWDTFVMNPDGSQGADVGTAQCVCSCATNCPAGATVFGAGCWGADLSAIPGACWIWLPGVTGETTPADLQGAYFSKAFDLGGDPVSGVVLIAVDDFAEVQINGSVVGSTGSITDYGLATAAQAALKQFDLTPFLVSGMNTITIRAQNGPSSFAYGCNPCSYASNPAGTVFGGTLTFTATTPAQRPTWGKLKADYRK